MIINSNNQDTEQKEFATKKELINKIHYSYKQLEELKEQQYLLQSYAEKFKGEKLDYENDIDLEDIATALGAFDFRIEEATKFIQENDNLIKQLEVYSIYREQSDSCQKADYKYYNCEICNDKLVCQGHKGYKYKYKNLGYF